MIATLGAALVAAVGVLYTAGAVINPSKRPDPVSAVIGYDEIFHALVIAAPALQYAALAFFVLPARASDRTRAAGRVRPRRGWRASGRA